jgi:hypothetical protein
MTLNNEPRFFDIDLNDEITDPEIYNAVEVDLSSEQQKNAIDVHPLPDLNINIAEVDNGDVQQNIIEMDPLPDLNINVVEDIDLYITPNLSLIEQSSYDLSVQPYQ